MAEYKYEVYLDGGKIRIKPHGTKKLGKVYGQPKNVAHFVITQIAQFGLDQKLIHITDDVRQIPNFEKDYELAIKRYLDVHHSY